MASERNTDTFVDGLRSLQPAATQMDQSAVFFDAGYRAGMTQASASKGKPWAMLACAALVGGLILSPASYHLGSLAETATVEASKDPTRSVPATKLADSVTTSATEQRTSPPIEQARDDQQVPNENTFAAMVGRWLIPPAVDAGQTLTASHSSALKQSDFHQQLSDISFCVDHRYVTSSADAATQTSSTRTLSMRDTNAMTMGDL